MITIMVKMDGYGDRKYEKITITKEELQQLACDKARDEYSYPNICVADDEITINTKCV